MSIYGNMFNLTRTDSLDSIIEYFDAFVCEDYTFNSLFVNEAFSINILNEGFDKKAIINKFKSGINIVVEKITDLINRIKEFIIGIKNKVINGIMKNNKEKAKKIIEDSKEVNHESTYFINESEGLDPALLLFDYKKLCGALDNNIDYLASIYQKFEQESYIESSRMISESYRHIQENIDFTKKEIISELFDKDKSKYTNTLWNIDDCMRWLKNNVVDNDMQDNCDFIIKELTRLEKELISAKSKLEKKMRDINSVATQNISMDNVKDIVNNYFNSKEEEATLAIAIKAAGNIVNYNANILYACNKVINSYLKDTQMVFHAINKNNKEK